MKCIVIIPIYKTELNADEASCVQRYIDVLRGEALCFVGPESLERSYYQERFPGLLWEPFAPKYFKGTKGYNHLLLSDHFYERFQDYDYMLIAQTDAVLWGSTNRLEEFMETKYDYIGAPWIPERRIWEWRWQLDEKGRRKKFACCKKAGQGISMGNGGLCLRNIAASRALIREFAWRKCYWFWKRNEDIFFGVFGQWNHQGFQLADVETGKRFAREYGLKACIEEANQYGLEHLPYGVHGWQKEFASYQEMQAYLEAHGIWEKKA